MAGLGQTLNIAKNAVAAQQYALNVTGHNIANVNSDSYSRQAVTHSAVTSSVTGGLLMGNGVETQQIQRSADEFLDTRLIEQQSGLSALEASDSYMKILESLFNENSESSLDSLASQFWNAWQDLSNNPSGNIERIGIYESGVQISEAMNSLNEGLISLEADLNKEVEAAVSRIDSLTQEIAAVNKEIVQLETGRSANDQRDKRNELVSELAELMDIQSFEQPDGYLTLAIGGGYPLVSGGETYSLAVNEGQVQWIGSGGGGVDITDKIQGGKLGGWLEMRDATLPQYEAELDVLAREMIWNVNAQHSQGVGKEFFSAPVEGTYATDSSGLLSTLPFGDRIDYDKGFKMWIQDNSGLEPDLKPLEIDMRISTAAITDWSGTANAGAPPEKAPFTYVFTVVRSGEVNSATYDVSDPASLRDPEIVWQKYDADGLLISDNLASPISINNAAAIDTGDGLSFEIGDGVLVAGNSFTLNTDADPASLQASALDVAASGRANSVLDTYTFKVTSDEAGDVTNDAVEIEWSNSLTSGTFTLDPQADPVTVDIDGMSMTFKSGTVVPGDIFAVSTDKNGNPATQLPSEWHWTLDSFKGQFDREKAESALGFDVDEGVQLEITDQNTIRFIPENNNFSFAFAADEVEGDSGLMAALGINTFFTGEDAMSMGVNAVLSDVTHLAAARIDENGEYGTGDNQNALNIADLQYADREMIQWNFDRENGGRSETYQTTMQNYYSGMVGSIGLKSAEMTGSIAFSEVMVSQLTEQRNSISGVSLDEEMVNLIKFQQAFSAASKLLKVTDEMLSTLMSMR